MKLIDWILGLFGKKEEKIDPQKLDAWPFPVVLGTPPSCAKTPAKKKRGRPVVKKATTRKPAVKKTVKKTVVKLAKKAK